MASYHYPPFPELIQLEKKYTPNIHHIYINHIIIAINDMAITVVSPPYLFHSCTYNCYSSKNRFHLSDPLLNMYIYARELGITGI